MPVCTASRLHSGVPNRTDIKAGYLNLLVENSVVVPKGTSRLEKLYQAARNARDIMDYETAKEQCFIDILFPMCYDELKDKVFGLVILEETL